MDTTKDGSPAPKGDSAVAEKEFGRTPQAPDAVIMPQANGPNDVDQFIQSYTSFTRVLNSLQRKYIGLKEEFTQQNDALVEANRRLVDLSERNLAATGFLNSILDSVSAGVVAVDPTGCITHFNRAAAAITGVERNRALGYLYDDIMPVGEPEQAGAGFAVRSGQEVSSVQKKVRLADGRSLRLSVSTSILRDGDGRPAGAVEVFQDLTKISRMESELARLNTLAALGEMAATIAHEVRNPLAGIAGFAALLERDLDPEDPGRKIVRKIIRGVEALNQTVSTLLNYTRFKEITRSEVDYESFLRDTVDQFAPDTGKGGGGLAVDCRRESSCVGAEPLRLLLDRVLMRQVIHNIMTNATQAMDGRGRIKVRYRMLSPSEASRLYSESVILGSDETLVETVISDNGPGIHKHHKERIFAPFFSTRSGGNGLGLAVVWKIMKAHGGEVFTADVPRGGAAFHLLLPARIRQSKHGATQ
ncbi:MAG: ATP-binding protein [bacterium]